MDIFQFASAAMVFTDEIWICLLVGVLCFLLVYIFQGAGLYCIAKHEGYGNRWMAWVPGLQIYYIGVCSQKNKILNSVNTKNFAIGVLVLDIVMFAGYLLYYISAVVLEPYFTSDYMVYEYHDYFGTGTSVPYFVGFNDNLPTNVYWAAWIYLYLETYILQFLDLVFIIMKLFLYTSFYRTYSARRYMLFSVVGALFPVNGIMVYAVRNNKGINYNDYVRRIREENYRRYQQQQQNYNQNPYNQNPYSRGYGAPPQQDNPYDTRQSGPASDPFDEFGSGTNNSANNANNSSDNSGGTSSDDSPFDEFN